MATAEHVSRLARPLTLAGRTMRNRIVQAPMSVGYADLDGSVTPKLIDHYARRAAGGASMVITENFAVSDAGRQLPRQPLVTGEGHLEGLAALAQAIRGAGALAVLQIVHAGRYAGPWEHYESRRRLAPSAVAFELQPGRAVTPDEITPGEIDEVLAQFARAADLAARAGFDGVDIHGAQGMLISSFQSPRMNRRTDAYGTDRDRFAREVVEAVVGSAGDLLVGYHLFCDEMMPGGLSPADAIAFARQIEGAGVDFMIPIPTTFESLRLRRAADPARDPTAYPAAVARDLAAAVSTPLFANGGLGEADRAERVLEVGDVVAVALARPLFADPDWPSRALLGQPHRGCRCTPPICLQSQIDGSICQSWPEDVQARGYWGTHDITTSRASETPA